MQPFEPPSSVQPSPARSVPMAVGVPATALIAGGLAWTLWPRSEPPEPAVFSLEPPPETWVNGGAISQWTDDRHNALQTGVWHGCRFPPQPGCPRTKAAPGNRRFWEFCFMVSRQPVDCVYSGRAVEDAFSGQRGYQRPGLRGLREPPLAICGMDSLFPPKHTTAL